MSMIAYDHDGNPVVRVKEIGSKRGFTANMTGIFHIDGVAYDVSITKGGLSWTPLTGVGKGPKAKPKSKKRNKKCDDEVTDLENNSIKFENILGVKLRRLKRSGQQEGEGVCQGVSVYTYHKKTSVKLKDWVLNLNHPSEDTCAEWLKCIQCILRDFEDRPKRLKIFIQPHAGKKDGMSIFNTKIRPLFEAGNITLDMADVIHNEQIKQEMVHLQLTKYDSVVCVGGDGTVSKVMDGLITRTQKENDVEIRPNFGPVKTTTPLGIIPVGLTNQVAHTSMGIADPITAAIHIMLGHTHPLDVLSVYKKETFHKWALSVHYGYFGNVLPFLNRYALLGEKKLDAAFAKALTSSKFRSYECDISYIPSEVSGSSEPSDGTICRQGCIVCNLDPHASGAGFVYEDTVMSLNPLNESGNSSVLEVTNEENLWKNVKGNFVSVTLLSQPGLSDLAPNGMGPYTHLADGYMDLIMVHQTERKEFVRYLKRHGSDKNQLSFPFVESHRCREVRFNVRSHQTWNYEDLGQNEVIETSKKQEIAATQAAGKTHDDVLIIDQLESSSDEESESHGSCSSHTITESMNAKSGHEDVPAGAHIQDGTNTLMYVSGNYKVSMQEKERIRRAKSKQKKSEKGKLKAEAKSRAIWNIDNEIEVDQNLSFRVHQGLVLVHGIGIPKDYDPEAAKLGCFGIF